MPTEERPERVVAVLRDYPLRLWAEQSEYTDGLLREFNLLLIGEQSGELHGEAPGRLVELADMVTSRYGALLQQVTAERQEALDRGLDRMDSTIVLPEETPQLLAAIREVQLASDEFCRSASLLMLPRPPHLVALAEWSNAELLAQFHGAEPTPWPGPF